jgi:NAD(P)-dependent dehydrogenase (short-subunit alcohol dehydrogenase family)
MSVHLVIGATGGVGSALVARLLGRGDTVIAVGRDEQRLDGLADAHGVTTHRIDAADPATMAAVVGEVVDADDRLDGAVCLAGSLLLKPAHLTTPDEWDDAVAANLTSAFATVRAVAPALRTAGGSIVLTSSAAGSLGLPNHDAIAAVKAGVAGLVRSAAATYGARGVRVNAVAPGMVDTPLTARLTANDAQLEASRKMHVLGRIGTPDDVAGAIAWLLSDDAAWVTGQVVGVDGGLGAVRTRT